MKKTKVVCTMGPRTDDRNMMRALIKNGAECMTADRDTSDLRA